MITASIFDELEKIALNAGSRGGKVHHYTAKNNPVYQSDIDRQNKEKQSKGWTVGNIAKGVAGAASAVALGLAARKVLGNAAAKKAAERIVDNHVKWTNAKKAYENIYDIGKGVYHEADHTAGYTAFNKHFEDARKAHDSAHYANNWKKWDKWSASNKAHAASHDAYEHAKGVREDLHNSRQKAKWAAEDTE